MRVKPKFSFSKRATRPPSAWCAVTLDRRHHLELARLTWPALAWRLAGPQLPKISATSRAGRTTRPGLCRRLGPSVCQRRQAIERARDRADYVGGGDPARRARSYPTWHVRARLG